MVYNIHSRYLYFSRYNEPPKSLSATAALYDKPIFTIVMCFISIALLPCWLELMPLYQFLAFISCAGLLFVGVTTKYETNKLHRIIHFTGAYVGSISTVLIILLNGYYIALVPIILFMIQGHILYNIKKSWTYWFEIGLFYSIFISLVMAL